jgi:hypothetical protein
MKSLVSLLVLAWGASASAAPCFHVGEYSGAGIGKDAAGNHYVYEVSTTMRDNSRGISNYKWENGGTARFAFEAQGDRFVFGGDTGPLVGTIACGMGENRIRVTGKGFDFAEEWVFVGNYLLRRGMKTQNGVTVKYQELLVREK